MAGWDEKAVNWVVPIISENNLITPQQTGTVSKICDAQSHTRPAYNNTAVMDHIYPEGRVYTAAE